MKAFDRQRAAAVTEFMRTLPYRSLWTATPAPNDFIELGTSAEALGEMGRADMLSRFFKRDEQFVRVENLSGQGWRFRGHAELDFWRWVCSWSRLPPRRLNHRLLLPRNRRHSNRRSRRAPRRRLPGPQHRPRAKWTS